MIEVRAQENADSYSGPSKDSRPGRLRVLIVDDNPDDRAMVLRALKKEFRTVEATEINDECTGERALQASPFHLIITDYQLNWATGLDLLDRFKEHSPRCPIIMYTGSGNEEVAVRAMKSGVDDYVLKSPRHLAQLASSARALVEREANLKRAEVSEARLERLLSRINIAVFRSTLQGALLSANEAFLRILGFHSFEEAKTWKLDATARNRDGADKSECGFPEGGKCCVSEMKLRRAGGGEVWVSLWATVSPEDDNVLEVIFAEITERKQLEKISLEKSDAARQSEKLDSLGRLAGGIAHDFNNLLTAINGYSELLLLSIGETSDIRGEILEIQKAGNRAARITRELLAFGRRQMLHTRVLDLNAVVHSLRDSVLRGFGERIGYELNLAEDLSAIKADPLQIEIMIINLLFNAREALHPGGRIAIETKNVFMEEERTSQVFQQDFSAPRETITPGPYVSLSVADTGTGMDQATLSRVFEPFFTTKPVNNGTGLGLSTVYGIVKQSKGHIFVESAPGKGSIFRILFPATAVERNVNAPFV